MMGAHACRVPRVAAHLTIVDGKRGIIVEIDEPHRAVVLRFVLQAARGLRDVLEVALQAAEHELAEVGMRQ